MIPDRITESVTVVPLPNYVDKYDISVLDFMAVKRFQDKINCDPYLKPVHFADTIYCFPKKETKKRYVSQTYFEPRVKPRRYSESMVIYPKRPEKTFVACIDYHIDECRKWFRTTMEFTAKTITTRKIKSTYNPEKQMNGDINHNTDFHNFSNGPGASQILLPRFGLGCEEKKEKKTLVNGNIGLENLEDQIWR